MTINAANLTLGGVDAYVVAANGGTGTGTISLSNDFTNPGTVFSGHDLNLTAPNIMNQKHWRHCSNGTLHVTSTNDYIENYGAFYAGTLLDLHGAQYVGNRDTGTMDGGNDITITTPGVFLNNNDVIAAHDLTISANVFHNDVAGGDTRVWNYASTGFDPNTQSNRDSANDEDHDAAQNWAASEHHNDPDDDYGDTTYYHHATFTTSQSYSNGTPTHKPQLLANHALTIQNFQTATNIGGVISAPTVNIHSNLGGASFTNNDLALNTQHWVADWNNYDDCESVFQFDCDYTEYRSYDKYVSSTDSTSFGAGIFAGSLNATGFALNNAGSAATASVTSTSASGGTGTTLANGVNTVSPTTFGGITLSLPTNPNGYFVISKDPNSKYLVETNPRFGADAFLGSDYLAERYGVDIETLQRRLGDGAYEASLIRQQLVGSTGSNILINGQSEVQQMQRLMDNGADQGKAMGLTYGKAPTQAQLANLGQDMVWMVETEVGGQKVLAPVVYLSAATKSMITGGAVIAANDAKMNVTSLTNTGGTISGKNTLDVTSKGNVTNTGGTIKGGDVSVKSTDGSIINETTAKTGGTAAGSGTDIGKGASIQSTGNLALDAKNDITNKGANVSAGGNADLKAGNDITFDTIEDKKSSTTRGNRSESHEASTTQVKSGLTVGGDLSATVARTQLLRVPMSLSAAMPMFKAGGDLNVLARDNSVSSSHSSASGNILSGSSHTDSKTDTTNVGSNFNVGGNLKTNSAHDTTIQGSSVTVKGDGDMQAGGNMNILDGHNSSTSSSSDTHPAWASVAASMAAKPRRTRRCTAKASAQTSALAAMVPSVPLTH